MKLFEIKIIKVGNDSLRRTAVHRMVLAENALNAGRIALNSTPSLKQINGHDSCSFSMTVRYKRYFPIAIAS